VRAEGTHAYYAGWIQESSVPVASAAEEDEDWTQQFAAPTDAPPAAVPVGRPVRHHSPPHYSVLGNIIHSIRQFG